MATTHGNEEVVMERHEKSILSDWLADIQHITIQSNVIIGRSVRYADDVFAVINERIINEEQCFLLRTLKRVVAGWDSRARL
ncbi:hypothetical protein J6590_071760 [Homalodisca vitripennis]|nr:hypothetical protein J6590_071760 [Homalodisca vitripennis]